LDLGKNVTNFCEVADGAVVQRGTVSSVESLRCVLGPEQPPARVAIEACREAWFVHDLLTSWGNEVLLVDTTRSRQLGIGQHGRKTDRIDAERLARVLANGCLPIAHVLSPARRDLREALGVRRALVEARAQLVTTARGVARAKGVTLPSCDTNYFVTNVRKKPLEPSVAVVLDPLLEALASINAQLDVVEATLAKLCEGEPVIQQLMTAPGVGTIVAACFVSVVDEAHRFRSAHALESYLGLVPNENSSGGKRRLGAITKQGNSYLRAMLVQGAWTVLRTSNKSDPLRVWAENVAARRGKRIAVVALARRLVGVLWAMWRDGTVYDAPHLSRQGVRGVRKAQQTLEQQTLALQAASKKQKRPPLKTRTGASQSAA
jgi:transposase